MENVINDFNLTNKLFGDNANKINYPIHIKDSRGNTIKIRFKDKGNDLLAPVDEDGQEIKDMRILKNIFELTKQHLNLEAEKKLFSKRYSVDINKLFKNPIIIKLDDENADKPKTIKIVNNNKNMIHKKSEDKGKLSKKENERRNTKLLNEIQKSDKKPPKASLSKSVKVNFKSNLKKNMRIKSPSKNKTIQPKQEAIPDNNNEFFNSIKVESEVSDPHVKELLNDIKNNPQNEATVYNEEDDFIKDFNFDFYSSGEETEAVTLQKKMRRIRKKKNKYLFSIFNYIAKNTNFNLEFTKGDLIKYLINEEFRYNFEQLKDQITKGRILSYNSIYTNRLEQDKKIFIKDLEIINYLYRYIEDKDSIFYKAIYRPKKRKTKISESYSSKLNNMFDNKKVEEGKRKKRFSVFQRRPTKEYLEDKYKISKKKFEKKKKPSQTETDIITQSEKKLIMLNEINLTNELKYQISIANDKESREKFKNLLNKIEALRNLDSNEYVKILKKNYDMYKEEVNEIIKAKEIEDRLNGFVDCLNYQRNNLKDKHKYITSLLLVRDNKFSSTFENNVSD